MIEFYYADSDKTITVNGKTCQKPTGHCLVMPSMVEGVAYYNNRLYVTFESPATKFNPSVTTNTNPCKSAVYRIAALDISADLAYLNSEKPEYDRVIDLGMVKNINSEAAATAGDKLECDKDGYEQVMLDKDFAEPVDGKAVKYNYATVDETTDFTQKVYI